MANPCPANNPCNCLMMKGSVPKSEPECPKGTTKSCLVACSDVLDCQAAVGPCGQVGTFDLSTLAHNTTGCAGPVKYSIECFDNEFLTSVSVDRNTGILTWVTGDVKTVRKYTEVTFLIECLADCEGCGALKSAGTFHIGVKDQCIAHSCQECEYCDPCDGLCKDKNVNIVAGGLSAMSNLSANG